MHSIRTKTTLLNIIAIAVAIIVTTVISAFSIASLGHQRSEETLSLLCTTGKNNLNYYFKSIEQSTNTVSHLIDADLDAMEESTFITDFSQHVDDARTIFSEASKNTNGVLTYYYRVDPAITDQTGEKGFWYTNLDGKGFVEHEVTDLTDDQFECIWFYQPKNTGKPIWLPPYVTDNLDVYVLSYNVPVYRGESFVGVVGIEISYVTVGAQIQNIKFLESGFAYIIENEGCSIIYHPSIDILGMPEDQRPSIPEGFLTNFKKGEHHIQYTFQGVTKHSYWLDLENNMSIVVAVPLAEINLSWQKTLIQIVISAVVIIAAFTVITILYSRKLTKPLKDLSDVAEKINAGDYTAKIEYKNNDEIGVLTTIMNKLVDHLGAYIEDLNQLAYTDSLTEVQSKSAYDIAINEIQAKIATDDQVEFAIGVFDCDNLKTINDKYGHDKGNIYLKSASHLIGRVFENSKVYRIGGDEFIVILEGEDYKNREKLKQTFLDMSNEVCAFVKEPWEKIKVSVGIAAYDPKIDADAHDVMVHADHLMYENKRQRKEKSRS